VVAFLSLKRTSVQVIYLRNWKLETAAAATATGIRTVFNKRFKEKDLIHNDPYY